MARKTASDFFDNEPVNVEKQAETRVKEEKTETVESTEDKDNLKDVYEKEVELKESVPTVLPTSTNQTQEEYMKQYQQYMQQYQQYYAQYYSQYYPQSASTAGTSDPAYEYFTGSSAATTTPPTISFDATRASRQMSAYFDPTKFQAVLSPEMLAAQRAQKEQQQSKLTAKEIEAFKKKKIEKKKAKNRWFYE